MKLLIFSLSMLCLAYSGCSPRPVSEKHKTLVEKYRLNIGCSGYGRLKPAKGEHSEAIKICANDYAAVDPGKKIATAHAYESLNKGVLFLHLAYKSENPERIYDAVNYLYDIENDQVIGFYKCYR